MKADEWCDAGVVLGLILMLLLAVLAAGAAVVLVVAVRVLLAGLRRLARLARSAWMLVALSVLELALAYVYLGHPWLSACAFGASVLLLAAACVRGIQR